MLFFFAALTWKPKHNRDTIQELYERILYTQTCSRQTQTDEEEDSITTPNHYTIGLDELQNVCMFLSDEQEIERERGREESEIEDMKSLQSAVCASWSLKIFISIALNFRLLHFCCFWFSRLHCLRDEWFQNAHPWLPLLFINIIREQRISILFAWMKLRCGDGGNSSSVAVVVVARAGPRPSSSALHALFTPTHGFTLQLSQFYTCNYSMKRDTFNVTQN